MGTEAPQPGKGRPWVGPSSCRRAGRVAWEERSLLLLQRDMSRSWKAHGGNGRGAFGPGQWAFSNLKAEGRNGVVWMWGAGWGASCNLPARAALCSQASTGGASGPETGWLALSKR